MDSLLTLMHDTAHDLSRISMQVALVKKVVPYFKEKCPELGDFFDKSIITKLDQILVSNNDLKEKLDRYYLSEKNK